MGFAALYPSYGNACAPTRRMGRVQRNPSSRHDSTLPEIALATDRATASVRIHDGAEHDAVLLRPVIAGATVHRRPLVPHQHIADPPAVIVDEALLRRVLGQFLDQRPGLV